MNSYIEARLNGFFDRSFVVPKERVLFDFKDAGEPSLRLAPTVRIHDARALQERAPSTADFFAAHGFALLSHATSVGDWNTEMTKPRAENDVARVYAKEVEELIRCELLPGRDDLVIQQNPAVMRRGPGTENPYGAGVHQDYGLTADDYEENVAAYAGPEAARHWRARFDDPSVRGYLVINFWRPVNMQEPIQHMPLCVCDPNTVSQDDVVPTGLVNFAPTGRPSNQLALKYDPEQMWYYYPAMTCDEVLAFKNFQYFKGEDPILRTCCHSAFEDPTAREDAETRQSCEYRASVFVHYA